MLVKDSVASAGSDSNNAMIQETWTAQTSTVVNEQRNLDRPHASAYKSIDIVFFEPILADVRSVGESVTDMQSITIQSGVLKKPNNFDWRSWVVTGAVKYLISLHALSGYNLDRAIEENFDLIRGN